MIVKLLRVSPFRGRTNEQIETGLINGLYEKYGLKLEKSFKLSPEALKKFEADASSTIIDVPGTYLVAVRLTGKSTQGNLTLFAVKARKINSERSIEEKGKNKVSSKKKPTKKS